MEITTLFQVISAALLVILLRLPCHAADEQRILATRSYPTADRGWYQQFRYPTPNVPFVEPSHPEPHHSLRKKIKDENRNGYIAVTETTTYHDIYVQVPYTFTTITSYSPTSLGYTFWPTHGWYRVYSAQETFDEAKKRCEKDGARMIVLNSKDEADRMVAMLKDWLSVTGWVGITDSVTEGTWLTIFGAPISTTYEQWAVNQPVSDPALDCVYMDAGVAGMMVNNCNTFLSAAVCEM